MARRTGRIALALAFFAVGWLTPADAAFYGMPRRIGPNAGHLSLSAASLPPLGHTRFCLRYPQECVRSWMPAHLRSGGLDRRRWTELLLVNHAVNSSIIPERNDGGIFAEQWVVAPTAGDCNDYAVTKRHRLLARGWPSQSLLLAEVATRWGEHHLVLVIRTAHTDLVLDNITGRVLAWSQTGYRWVRVQSPDNPRYWLRVSSRA